MICAKCLPASGINVSFLSFIIPPPLAPICNDKHNQLLHKVFAENQFPPSVHNYMNFWCLSCSRCWNVYVSHSPFHSKPGHCISVLSWVVEAAQVGFLKFFPMTTLSVLVNTVAANQIEYAAIFYWRIGAGAISVINLDSKPQSWSQGSQPFECHLAWLTQELLHTYSVLIDMSAFPLYNWSSWWLLSSLPDALFLESNIMLQNQLFMQWNYSCLRGTCCKT